MRRLASSIAVALALMATAPVRAQDPLDPEDPPATVRTGQDAADRITVPIMIGGRGPWHFIVDTGSQRTVISRELADRLALRPDAPVKVLSITGVSAVDTVTVPRLSFGSSNMEDLRAPVFAGDHLGGPGLLGLDGLRAKRLVLDFRRNRMDILSSRLREPRDPDAIIVEARSRLGQLILIDSTAEGRKVHVILDTGSEYSIGNLALMRRLAKNRPGRFSGAAAMTSVTGEQLSGQWGMLERITLGRIGITNLPVVFADAGPFRELGLQDRPALLLGVNALRGFDRVAIDFGRRRVDFLPPDESALPMTRLASLGWLATVP